MKTNKGKQKFLELLTGLCEMADKKYSKALLEIYYTALSGYSISDVEKAVYSVILNHKYKTLPMPAEIIEQITGGEKRISDVADIQAGLVLEKIKRDGPYKSIEFEDAVTQAVITRGFGGWVKLCSEMKEEDEKWFIKDFIRIYGSYARNQVTETGRLAGIHEITNNTGYEPETVKIKGNSISELTEKATKRIAG